MARGDAEAAAKQQHGIQFRPDPPAPLTIEQRVEALEKQVAGLTQTIVELTAAKSEAKEA